MSEWIIETRYLDSDGSSQITVGRSSGRIRSISEVYSIDSSTFDNDNRDSRVNSEDGKSTNYPSPMLPNGFSVDNRSYNNPEHNEILSGSFALSTSQSNLRSSRETRGRLFSELSLSDLPADGNDGLLFLIFIIIDNAISLDIVFPCSYEENMENRGKAVARLRQAAIKRVMIRSG